jgi:hypothetical protein
MAATNKIIFEKPDIASLKRTYTVFDLHFHTRYSDGHNSVEAIARRARLNFSPEQIAGLLENIDGIEVIQSVYDEQDL